MYILSVIPVVRGPFGDELTYFASEEFSPGTIVQIHIRKRRVHAIVTGCAPAHEHKAALKAGDFSLKKVTKIKARTVVHAAVITAAQKTAEYYVQPLGSVVRAVISQTLFCAQNFAPPPNSDPSQINLESSVWALQTNDRGRVLALKRHVRERFASKQSVIVCVPTLASLDAWYGNLSHGIEDHTFVLHGDLPTRTLAKRCTQARTHTHPVLVLCTPTYLSLPVPNLGSLVLEHESWRAYRNFNAPYIDFRFFAEAYARARGATLLYADRLLSIERLERIYRREIAPVMPTVFPPQTPERIKLVNLKNQTGMGTSQKYDPLGDTAKELLTTSLQSKSNVFVFVHRKGLAPITACDDCGAIVSCVNCDTPMTLLALGGSYRCPRCRATNATSTACGHCGSWRLTMLGAGMARVRESLATIAPGSQIFELDNDHVRSHAEAQKVMDAFINSHGTVLLGTDMALYYLHKPVDASIIVSLDSYLALPDFRSQERIAQILAQISDVTDGDTIVQTRRPAEAVFSAFVRGDLRSWIESERTLRKEFGYPPHTLFVKITAPDAGVNSVETLRKFAAVIPDNHKIATLYLPHSGERKEAETRKRAHLLLKVEAGAWPNANIIENLRSLPLKFQVCVDPETLF